MSTSSEDGLAEGLTLRQSPVVLWGLGRTARELTERVAQRAPAHSDKVHLLKAGGDFRVALSERIAGLAERGRLESTGQEIEVRLVVSAWEPADPPLPLGPLLEQVSDILAASAPGRQSLTLTLLIPPSIADDHDLEAAQQALAAAEAAMGRVRFLSSAFVFQVPLEVYRAAGANADSLQDLSDFLLRSALDAETTACIHRLADPLIRNRRNIEGEPAAFSTLAAQRVLYDQAELVRYLQARFQRELLQLGLYDRDDLSPREERELRGLGTKLTDDVLQSLRRRHTGLSPWTFVDEFAETEPPQPELFRRKLQQAVGLGETRVRNEIAELLAKLDSRMRAAFDALLDRPPGFFAAAGFFLDVLRGTPDESDDAADVVGILGLERAFRKAPMRPLAEKLFTPWFETTLARYDLSPIPENAKEPPPDRQIVSNAADLLAVIAETEGPGLVAPARFLVLVWQRVQLALAAPAATTSDGQSLFADITELLLTESAAFRTIRDDLLEQMRELRRTYPWYRFWRLLTYLRERRKLRERLSAVADAYRFTRRLYVAVVNQFLWPHHTRVLMIDGFRDAYEGLRAKFERYVGAIQQTFDTQWAGAQDITKIDRWSATTVNSGERFDTEYQLVLPNPTWHRLPSELVQFVPDAAEWRRLEPPEYAECKSLRDHFHVDVELLIRRVADFARELFKAARSLDVLDAIALQGEAAARKFFAGVLAKTEALPEFNAGRVPQLIEHGLFHRQRLIRCPQGVRDKLRSGYGDLVDENDEFIVVDNPGQLDITTFTIGFPASLLHALASPSSAPHSAAAPADGARDAVPDGHRSGPSLPSQ